MKNRIEKASKILKQKLLSIDFDKYEFKIGYENYLKNYIEMYDVIIQRYMAIIQNNFDNNDLKNKSFMDYGGGTGILSLLAKLAGIGYVCYVDISKDYADSFSKLAKEINIEVDDVLIANYNELDPERQFDVIANYDVLEHIDKPLLCFINLKKHLKKDGVIYMGSGANKYNYISYYLNIIKHKKVEPLNINSKNHKKRYEYIRDKYELLSKKAVRKLAFATRGLKFSSIDAFIELYLIIGYKPSLWIKTNTAPPENGVWSEHCFDFFNFAKELNSYFSKAKVELGYYPIAKPKFEKPVFNRSKLFSLIYPFLRYLSLFLAPVLNFFISFLPGKSAFYIAPYYIIKVRK